MLRKLPLLWSPFHCTYDGTICVDMWSTMTFPTTLRTMFIVWVELDEQGKLHLVSTQTPMPVHKHTEHTHTHMCICIHLPYVHSHTHTSDKRWLVLTDVCTFMNTLQEDGEGTDIYHKGELEVV